MKNQLINDINNYIEYLNNNGLQVTVHGKDIGGLLQHNIHTNSFCTYVKTDDNAWKRCIECQKKVIGLYEKEFLFGMCHAGVEEYVFFVSDKTFISVSGYAIDSEKAKKKIHRLCDDFYLDKNELLSVYDKLNHNLENINDLKVKIKPLCYMLRLLQIYLGNSKITSGNTLYDNILAYIQRNFMQQITISDIANACLCSNSTVSHLFKSQSGKTVNEFITELRIKQAKNLLKTTDLSISEIAIICGFDNINYFPTTFKRYTNITPTEYRHNKTDL